MTERPRERDTEQLRTTEERLTEALATARMAYWDWDPDTGQTVASASLADVFGLNPGEPLGTSDAVFALVHPEDRERYRDDVLGALSRGVGWHTDFRIVRPRDGRVAWLEQRASIIVEPDGRRRASGFVWDVTERRQAEAALRATDEKYRHIVAGARDYAILTTDSDGIIETWTPGAEAVFGWSEAEAIGQPVAFTFTPEDRAKGEDAKERALARRDGSAPDVRWHVRKDGTFVFIDGVMRVLHDSRGRVRGYLKVGQDVTERRRTDRTLRELNESLEQRVAERTADLARANEALTMEMEQRAAAEESRKAVLRRLVTSEEDQRRRLARELHDQMGQQVTALLLGLASLSREVTTPEQEQRIRNLEQLAAGIADDLHTLALELRPAALDNLGLRLALQSHLEEWSHRHRIQADFHSAGLDGEKVSPEIETTIYRIVQESLTNVLKHAGASRVSLVLERRNDEIIAIVEDDGAGFDVDSTLAAADRARRLGLRSMQERVILLGGSLEIESSAGRGTSVFVRLPLETGDESND